MLPDVREGRRFLKSGVAGLGLLRGRGQVAALLGKEGKVFVLGGTSSVAVTMHWTLGQCNEPLGPRGRDTSLLA